MDKNEFAKAHLGLVHACCNRFKGKGIEYEELYSAGCLGLAKAINNFDESRGLQFSTYAFPVIMGELKRLFRDGGSVKVSRSLKELSLKISRINNEYSLKSGRELSVNELADKLCVTPEQITEALNSAQPAVSIDYEDDETAALVGQPFADGGVVQVAQMHEAGGRGADAGDFGALGQLPRREGRLHLFRGLIYVGEQQFRQLFAALNIHGISFG